ncbi:MAG: hypothetical protein IJ760_01000 [Bacteroidales bacterium]|nr:hypothetical protein [Bacteroidales bacterium]
MVLGSNGDYQYAPEDDCDGYCDLCDDPDCLNRHYTPDFFDRADRAYERFKEETL